MNGSMLKGSIFLNDPHKSNRVLLSSWSTHIMRLLMSVSVWHCMSSNLWSLNVASLMGYSSLWQQPIITWHIHFFQITSPAASLWLWMTVPLLLLTLYPRPLMLELRLKESGPPPGRLAIDGTATLDRHRRCFERSKSYGWWHRWWGMAGLGWGGRVLSKGIVMEQMGMWHDDWI